MGQKDDFVFFGIYFETNFFTMAHPNLIPQHGIDTSWFSIWGSTKENTFHLVPLKNFKNSFDFFNQVCYAFFRVWIDTFWHLGEEPTAFLTMETLTVHHIWL